MNLLGPLVNPAQPPLQVMGIYDPTPVAAAASTLRLLGCQTALVVHGSGLDEIALHGPTQCALLRAGQVETLTLTPADMGVPEAPLSALVGDSPSANARWLEQALAGHGSEAQLNAVAVNCGALLWLADKAANIKGRLPAGTGNTGRRPLHRAPARFGDAQRTRLSCGVRVQHDKCSQFKFSQFRRHPPRQCRQCAGGHRGAQTGGCGGTQTTRPKRTTTTWTGTFQP